MGGGVSVLSYAFPAEFEPHESLWLSWPTYENKRGRPSETVTLAIIAATRGRVKIDLIVRDEEELTAVRRRLADEGDSHDHVRFHTVPHGDIWMRDMGPIFLKGPDGLAVASFGFNMWGYESKDSENSELERRVGRLVAEELGLPVVESELVSEGGDREINGEGTMMAVKAVETQRNPGWSLEEIEAELLRVLGQNELIWLEEGVAEDDHTFKGQLPGGAYPPITTGGHIDEFARFADAHTVLLAEVTEEEREASPIAALSYERLETNRAILERATCGRGHPLRIVRVPVPDLVFDTMQAGDGVFDYIRHLEYEDGSRIEPGDTIRVVAATSYLNFQITNGLVLMQRYGTPKDARAKRILEEAFPGREVVAIDALNVNWGGGGIHCISQQQPALAE